MANDEFDKQHSRGKLHARERINLLLDSGSFVEIGSSRQHHAFGAGLDSRRPHGDAVVTGFGTIRGRSVYVYAQDFSVLGGTVGQTHAAKICKVIDLAMRSLSPIIGINDGAGARIQESVDALAGYGEIFRRHSDASGVIPQISVLAGPCAGGAAYAPALTDFIFMVKEVSTAFLTGPDIIRSVTGQVVSKEDLGGWRVHSRESGLCSHVSESESECFESVRKLVGYLPSSYRAKAPQKLCGEAASNFEDPGAVVPESRRSVYDVRDVIRAIIDFGSWHEISEHYAPNIVIGFGHVGGRLIAVVANQPLRKGGVLDIEASEKAARFVWFCDAFSIPIVSFVDTPGFLPGTDQERNGVIRCGAKLLYAYCEATTLRIQVILRKAYGGAYIVMDSLSIGSDLSIAWPSNEIAVMGPESAVEILFRREIHESDDREWLKSQYVASYRRSAANPLSAASRGHVDQIVEPADTRSFLIAALASLSERMPLANRKHGSRPL